jgi:F-type H+-transporting ATPase subunit b
VSRQTFRFLPGLFLAAALIVPAAPRLVAQEQTPTASSASQSSTPEAQSPEKNNQEEDENDAFRHSASVKAIGAKFGLTPEQASTAFELINFAVLAILIAWFLIKTLPKIFRDRTSGIQKHLVEARSATEEASARLSSVEARLSKLDEQIAAMRAQAEKDIASDEQRIKASIEEEKQRILAAAEQEISAATTQAHRQLQRYAADLAIEQAARKLTISAETDRLLVQDFARRLAGEKDGQN